MSNQSKRQNCTRRILFISPLDFWSMGNGKGGPALWQTLTGYASRGWEVYFITGNSAPKSSQDLLPDNIYVIRFDSPWLKRLILIKKFGFIWKIIWWFWFQIAAFLKAVSLNHRHQIHIVYGYEIYAVPVAKFLSKMWKIPVVSRFQGTSIGVHWRHKRFWKLRGFEHYVAYKIKTDLVIMTNDGTQGDKVLQQFGVDKGRVRFWMNGVDWAPFKKMDSQMEAKKDLMIEAGPVLLTVSRLASWKRVDRSIKALPEVVDAFPNLILIVVGSGMEKKKLMRLADELAVKKNIQFKGAVPHKKVPKYLAAADIFLSFYDWSNVGNPLLEAMMAGKCIVTLNNGDTGCFIKNGYNGLLLEYNNIPKLPQKIKELLANEKLRSQLGSNARKYAEEKFWSWDERIDAEINEVASLVNGSDR